MTKYIFIVGGVMSGVGKGVATASIGKLLQSNGYKVTVMKIDPYINVDAGTMNPIEHGEVFVTVDGLECDQDIGNYERFLNEILTRDNYLTTGSVYQKVIAKERNLEYKGKCVEVVPHIPDEVMNSIKKVGRINKADFVLVEIGGTAGEYQNMLFLEAIRMMKNKKPKDVLLALVSYLPIPKTIQEMKTKPTQNAVRFLNTSGLQPDLIIGRSSVDLDEPRKKKISVFCNVDIKDVFSSPNVDSIYEVPLILKEQGMDKRILRKLNMRSRGKDIKEWSSLVKKIKKSHKEVRIAIVGKYFRTGSFSLTDSYISILESIKHASWALNLKPVIEWRSAEEYEDNPKKLSELSTFDGVIIPGGFGKRGIEGKIKVADYCRRKKICFFGLCLGMQIAVISFARNVANIKKATSREFEPKTTEAIVDFMNDQKKLIKTKNYGGTMRLGHYSCSLEKDTIASRAYKKNEIKERHRHRYEINNLYRDVLAEKGLIFSGINKERDLVEIAEIKNHPFWLGTQFHPEFQSTPLHPHPLFLEFIKSTQR